MELKCAYCGSGTGYDSETPLELRENTYLEGVGQLCGACYGRISGEAERIDRIMAAAEAKRYNLLPLDPCKSYSPAVCENCFERRKPIGILLDYVVYKCDPCDRLFKKD